MKEDFTPKSRKENLVIQELEGEVLIYDLEKNKAFCLNETSALVWQSCDGSRTIAEISDVVGKQLNSQINEDLVWLALDQLSKESLVEKQTELSHKFKGVSRRDVIRKVALGTMIALPVVTSLVAPLAVHANSACIAGGACTCTATGTQGTLCTAATPCADTNCRCFHANSGNTTGTCQP